MRRFFSWIPGLWSNGVSLVGTVLTTVSAIGLVLLFGLDVTGVRIEPFAGTFLLVVLPALFLLGLLLIPLGLLFGRRKRPDARPLGEAVGALFSTPEGRRRLLVIGLLTLANVVLVAAATQRVMAWTSDPTFCGTTCHGVMEPEWETYHSDAHGQVACVNCHVGEGAGSYMHSKIDGLRQVWKTMQDSYTKPVPTPVHSLPPAAETCGKCHWNDRWHGDKLALYSHTSADETNSELVNVMVLKLGGKNPATGTWSGFHWHASPDIEVRYETYDEKRGEIGKITLLRQGKVVEEFLPGGPAKPVAAVRTMDCIDCHNRPTHRFDRSPARALDRAFESARLDRGVKWLREVTETVLANAQHTRAGVEADFRRELEAAYKAKHADAVPPTEALDKAAAGLAGVWKNNVFPDRAVAWGTYPSHLGHQTDTPAIHGCFRCHDDRHKTAAGKALSGDCEVCHTMVAQDEKRGDLDESLRGLPGKR